MLLLNHWEQSKVNSLVQYPDIGTIFRQILADVATNCVAFPNHTVTVVQYFLSRPINMPLWHPILDHTRQVGIKYKWQVKY